MDVILTNPPFGGEEERGILGNFPADKQTSETALLFLQLIMRKLKRPACRCETQGEDQAAGPVVVPNGTLFGDGVCARIKEELLTEFNLHTIVRLPKEFSPLTPAFRPISFLRPIRTDEGNLVLRDPPPQGGNDTPNQSRSNSRSSLIVSPGGGTQKENELLESGCR